MVYWFIKLVNTVDADPNSRRISSVMYMKEMADYDEMYENFGAEEPGSYVRKNIHFNDILSFKIICHYNCMYRKNQYQQWRRIFNGEW